MDDLKDKYHYSHPSNIRGGAKPVVDFQIRLKPTMKEVVRKEVIRLLDAGIIYPVVESEWVSPVHYVPKKGGFRVVPDKNNE
jgi:hypothetical protein